MVLAVVLGTLVGLAFMGVLWAIAMTIGGYW